MVVLVAALLLLGILLGTVAHVPASVSVVAGTVIACWLLVFAAREYRAKRRRTARH
ncbi:hypothetical protein [Streptomyces sp. NPDC005805]|uniref:hypothetical protein n=1 Tax=Streptomyces sp. NPDC005805 TaxID=3157068 RepID=UPI003403F4EC